MAKEATQLTTEAVTVPRTHRVHISRVDHSNFKVRLGAQPAIVRDTLEWEPRGTAVTIDFPPNTVYPNTIRIEDGNIGSATILDSILDRVKTEFNDVEVYYQVYCDATGGTKADADSDPKIIVKGP